MNKKHHARKLLKRLHKRSHRRILYALGGTLATALIVFAGLHQPTALVSPEVHFADAVPSSGMQIVPASCASSPGGCLSPGNLQGSCDPSTHVMSLSWGAVSGADYYNLYLKDNVSGYEWNNGSPIEETGTSVSQGGLYSSSYSWSVAACDNSGCSPATSGNTVSCQASTTQQCPDGSAAPNNDPTQCTCAQGNQSACTTSPLSGSCTVTPGTIDASQSATWSATVSGGTPPYQFLWADSTGNSTTGTASSWGPITYSTPGSVEGGAIVSDAAGNDIVTACSLTVQSGSGMCPDGSAAPNGDTTQCTCDQGNLSACTNSCPAGDVGTPPYCTGPIGGYPGPGAGQCPAGYTGTYPECTPGVGAPIACDMSFTPTTIYSGDYSTLTWNADSAGTLYDVYGTSAEPSEGSLAVTTSESTTYSFLADSGSYCYATLDTSGCVAGAGNACTSAANDCGLTDGTVQCDGSCGAPPDSECSPGITVVKWGLLPSLVQSGESTTIQWQVQNASQCTVTGSNGDGTGSNGSGVWNTSSGSEMSSPITSQTVYTLSCTPLPHALPDTPILQTATVNIVPGFEEQ